MINIVTGGAGFIANTLIDRLLEQGRRVVAFDNLKLGRLENLSRFYSHPGFQFVQIDVASPLSVCKALEDASNLGPIDEIWHLAANSDIPSGVANPDIDFRDTFLTTFELLKAIKGLPVKRFLFASSSAIYGDQGEIAIHENIGPLFPISNYGAMKLASEAQISAAVESHLSRAICFRFPNVVGVPATHGVILDFVRKLMANPDELHVLGDGTQQKAYLHVSDLVDAMLKIRDLTEDKRAVFNIGPVDEGVTVRWIAERVADRVSPSARILFGEGNKGWVGDVPKFKYSTEKVRSLGWSPVLGSQAAILRAIDEIACQQGA
jgi:UDP-glucose 4-epimerase